MDARAALTVEQLDRFARTLDALAPSGRIGLAVSGGPDSLALLILAIAARPGLVWVATVDHGLRPEAAEEAAMVYRLCQALGVPHAILRVVVADDPKGLQAAARMARYKALATWAVQNDIAHIATAHHADDQAETVLMRLARGAGLRGLSGIRRSRALDSASATTLIRPLLEWTKKELEDIVAAADINPAHDPSNSDPRYDRTHARRLLAGGWPVAIRIAAAARHLAEAEEALDWIAQRIADERIQLNTEVATADPSGLPRALRLRLLTALFTKMAPDVELRGDSVDRLLTALDARKAATLGGFRCDPGPPWRVERAAARRSDRRH